MTVSTLIILVLFSWNSKSEVTFSLKGKTNDIENGTIIYIENNLSRKVIDSTVVKNNQFYFSTNIEKFPIRVLLRTKDYSKRRDIWLEKESMIFDASSGDFETAIVTGSQSESLSQKLYNNIGKLSFEERNKLEKQFVEDNPESIVSAFILSVFSRDWGLEFTRDIFDGFPDKIKSSQYGALILDYIKLNKNVKIGSNYANFGMRNQEGKELLLSDLRGKVTLLEFWASWCTPCRKENPNLVKTYEKYNTQGFEIFAVSLDSDKDKWLTAIENDGLKWPNFCDFEVWENEPSLMYGVYAVPENFLIGSDGVIVARNIRGEELNAKLAELLR